MKKKTTLELVEQSEKVSLYSISFAMDRKTEFECFLNKFEKEASLNRDYQRIIYALSIILENGALERYFRPEGKRDDSLRSQWKTAPYSLRKHRFRSSLSLLRVKQI